MSFCVLTGPVPQVCPAFQQVCGELWRRWCSVTRFLIPDLSHCALEYFSETGGAVLATRDALLFANVIPALFFHHICLPLQPRIIIERQPRDLPRRPHSALHLLYRMPRFMRQSALPPRPNMDVCSTRIRQRPHLCRLRGVAMDAHTRCT